MLPLHVTSTLSARAPGLSPDLAPITSGRHWYDARTAAREGSKKLVRSPAPGTSGVSRVLQLAADHAKYGAGAGVRPGEVQLMKNRLLDQ